MSERVAGVELGAAVVDRLLAAGVTEIVLAPGSRNAPLGFAAWAAAEAGRLRLHTRIDERSAGFLGLGLSKVGARAAVVCTSGTAVANLHPAVLEAAHAGIAVVVVTADRPARMRETGANQTTDQVGIFGPLVRTHDLATIDDLADVPWAEDGPTHVNVQLDVPLVPGELEVAAPATPAAPAPPAAPEGPPVAERLAARGSVVAQSGGSGRRVIDDAPAGPSGSAGSTGSAGVAGAAAVAGVVRLRGGPRTVVVAGDDAGPPSRVLAERAGWPLLAEPSSGARTGDNAMRCYRPLLAGPLGAEIERVVVFGRPTLSRPVTALLERSDVEVLVVPGRGVWPVRPPGATVLDGRPEAESADDSDWLDRWREADREVGRRLDALLAQEPLTPYAVAGAVSRALPAGGLLVVGASSPIRDLDLMHRPATVGERRKIIANRGLAGIDGTISTAIGAALGRPDSTRALALMGDVTFLHDQSSLVLGPQEQRPDLTIVVPNDDGGSIFAMLEQGAAPLAPAFERLFGTPHGVDLGALCGATRTPYLKVTSLPELEQALASPNGGIEVIEAVVSRADRRGLDERIRALAHR
ncbi:2-succinyl-5-enolpyruvyl-6-hydroxy-3-cyclohexene-1-carboxylate synthase [Nocardioides thalensis]|uniref:2-succinyl-5-enolpyruvyl-6-hydroxy-3-cyclohexene-1-carboxylate synthase n=1 Tax=Nocardioides thalensis TaxID=1914755 RepID=A0A853BWA3_9ACTN|nr:2-succinyl-5-enolpyruvyl-6-hydroxy-3-cyclohexene-1-carboxylate synthase [Nocardioides thalensis]